MAYGRQYYFVQIRYKSHRKCSHNRRYVKYHLQQPEQSIHE